jgi:hypothetical protein
MVHPWVFPFIFFFFFFFFFFLLITSSCRSCTNLATGEDCWDDATSEYYLVNDAQLVIPSYELPIGEFLFSLTVVRVLRHVCNTFPHPFFLPHISLRIVSKRKAGCPLRPRPSCT